MRDRLDLNVQGDFPIVFRFFHVRSISEMLKKPSWEISNLRAAHFLISPYSVSVLRVSGYSAINAAITAFHLSLTKSLHLRVVRGLSPAVPAWLLKLGRLDLLQILNKAADLLGKLGRSSWVCKCLKQRSSNDD